MPSPEEIASFVAERAREDPKVRRVVEDVKLFDGLMEHAGWQRLAQKLSARRQAASLSIANRLMSGEKVEQTEIEFQRGFYAGAEYVIRMPAEAEASLETAAREAWGIAQQELAREVEESSAYLNDPTGGE